MQPHFMDPPPEPPHYQYDYYHNDEVDVLDTVLDVVDNVLDVEDNVLDVVDIVLEVDDKVVEVEVDVIVPSGVILVVNRALKSNISSKAAAATTPIIGCPQTHNSTPPQRIRIMFIAAPVNYF